MQKETASPVRSYARGVRQPSPGCTRGGRLAGCVNQLSEPGECKPGHIKARASADPFPPPPYPRSAPLFAGAAWTLALGERHGARREASAQSFIEHDLACSRFESVPFWGRNGTVAPVEARLSGALERDGEMASDIENGTVGIASVRAAAK